MFKEEINLYETRIDEFVNRLEQLIYKKQKNLQVSYFSHDKKITSYEDRLKGKPKTIKTGTAWGENFQRAWFHIEANLSAELKNKNLFAIVNLGGEGLVFSNQGIPYQSVSSQTVMDIPEFKREVIPINNKLIKDGKVDFWIEATAGQLFGLELQKDFGNTKPETFGQYKAIIKKLNLATCNEDLKSIYYDFYTLNQLRKSLPEDNVRRKKILYSLNQAINAFDSSDNGLSVVKNILSVELSKKSNASSLTTFAVGHAHLDTAWLWTEDETIRKCARTFSNQLRNFEKFDDYIFAASQAQHYAFVKKHYPKLYQQIKDKVKEGKWELQGGMWVEADCNVINGESIIRQILYGKKFFQDEFGIEVNYLWIPDVFGYSASMPQIIKKTGMEYFVTQKLSWNQFNDFPHNTFRWEGIDGTEVITHFPPEDNYNSELNPVKLKYSQKNFNENHILNEYLTPFGIGDGGGGPTEKIIETGRRCKDLEGLPQVNFDKTESFLKKLDKYKDQLHKWSGELYLELHRGTYTTHAYNKKINRFLENKMRELEILYSCGLIDEYPQSEFEEMWKKILKNQFHDIIPGSSITPVYSNIKKEYKELWSKARNLKNQFSNEVLQKNNDKISFVNSLSFNYANYHVLPADWNNHEVLDENGDKINAELIDNELSIYLEIPPLSSRTITKGKKITRKANSRRSDDLILENNHILYKFNKNGQLIRAYDKEVRKELIKSSQTGNSLKLYEDRPISYDAWDIDIFYEKCLRNTARKNNSASIFKGKIRQEIQFKLKIGSSEIEQKVILSKNSKRLDFQTKINWQEDHKLLRVHFPVNIKANLATYDIQYGKVKRPTHRNTSRDMARFEVVGHKYADLSENDYGIALLNNCKYGYKVYKNDISLSLLRAPTSPDPQADRGKHEFTYSLLPHNNNLINSEVIAESYQLNHDVSEFRGYDLKNFSIPIKLSNQDIILETVKKCEYEDSIILRLYEPYGLKTTTMLSLFFQDIKEIYETDMLENNSYKITPIGNEIELRFTPYEIKTIKIVLSK